MLHINRGQPGAARSSEKQYTKPWRVAWRVAWRVPSSPATLRVHPMKVFRRNHEESRSLAFCRAIQYTNQQLPREEAQPRWGKRTQAARTSGLTVMMSPPFPPNTQQQPADISDERQPFTYHDKLVETPT
ncbi:hypothetical protein QJQ45_013919 [Haematococcus lacustris]|nr:hypothetical protein QJQ45_013919 [Haematococcus lacustris]